MNSRWAQLLIVGGCLGALQGQAGIQEISPAWQPADKQRLEIASAEASASFDAQYAPNHIHDGDRHTKWVCPAKPSEASPQWISLRLANGVEEVNSVAVFGEATNNDGIRDAQIQVESNGTFKTVATIRDASSASWLASFEPVRTSKVRLLVTRSGGPTEHTDVFEVEIYRRPFTEQEVTTRFSERLRALPAQIQAAADTFKEFGAGSEAWPQRFRAALEKLRTDGKELEHDLRRWDTLDVHGRNAAMHKADKTVALAQRLRARALAAAKTSQHSLLALAEGRKERGRLTKGATAPGMVVADLTGEQAKLANDRLLLLVDTRDGTWNALWAEGVEVALFGVGFGAEADGQGIAKGRPKTVSKRFQDPLGKGQELVQVWETKGLWVERNVRLYDGLGVLTIGGRIVNDSAHAVKLGTAHLMELRKDGWWWSGHAWEAPASIYIASHSQLCSSPFESEQELNAPADQSYQSSGVLGLTSRQPEAALTLGYVRADEASPDLAGHFRLNQGGDALSASSRFLGRVLGPKEVVVLNTLYISGSNDPFEALEAYGAAMAKFSVCPVRTGPTSLWCSWYAHRMGMTEEKVLANAEVAARRFKPLGLEIMQLDHGWQRGDVTGDWVPNERFPHGLSWLAEQLRERHGLRLGVWIAPTDVAETSLVFQQHPDWMLKGDDGKPRVNWRWYWKPNPNCFELDATHPAAFQSVVDTFRQLTSWGVSYYKIDFIASSGGEHFVQQEPKATRGWSNLRRAMEAIRTGAGEAAWIRYCQTPPILSAGLANSAYGGGDTLDAGVPGRFDVLLENAHSLAAGYWLNDRPYHREVCDMSVRMQGSVEEARVRAAIVTLANCSISWSDELCYLPPSRIHLMQQCMPPGNPPMTPIDLFERHIPSIWHIKAKNQAEAWDVVGFFNFTTNTQPRSVRFSQLGLDSQNEYAVFEFWEEKLVGIYKAEAELTLPPESSRIISIRKLSGVPQLIGTDMHVLQGYHEVKGISWDAKKGVLSGNYRRMVGIPGKAFIYVPEGYSPKFEFPLSPASARLTHVEGKLWMQEVNFADQDLAWTIPFETPKKPEAKEPNG